MSAIAIPVRAGIHVHKQPIAAPVRTSINWDHGLSLAGFNSIFLSDRFLVPFETYLQRPIRRHAGFHDGTLAAGFSGLVEKVERGLALRRIPLLPWQGFWLGGGDAEHRREEVDCDRVFNQIVEEIRRDYVSASFDLHPGIIDVRPFQWAGWTSEVRYTYQTTLKDWNPNTAESTLRRRARRAAAAGVSIADNLSPADFATLWCRSQKAGADSNALRTLLVSLLDRGLCQLWGAYLPDGTLAACTSLLFDGATAYYWLAAFDRGEPHHGASNQLLHMEILRNLGSTADLLDWVGANTPSIARYKQSFGPCLVSYQRVHWKAPVAREQRSTWRSWMRSCPLFQHA
jgi:hypothetical protein